MYYGNLYIPIGVYTYGDNMTTTNNKTQSGGMTGNVSKKMKNKIPMTGNIYVVRRGDYYVRNLEIDEMYDRVLVVMDGIDVVAYFPILGDDDLSIIHTIMQSAINSRKKVNEGVA